MTMNSRTKRIQPMTLAGLVLDREDDADLLAACKDGGALSPRIPKEAPGAPARPEGGGGAAGRPPPAGAPLTAQGSAPEIGRAHV